MSVSRSAHGYTIADIRNYLFYCFFVDFSFTLWTMSFMQLTH